MVERKYALFKFSGLRYQDIKIIWILAGLKRNEDKAKYNKLRPTNHEYYIVK